MYQMLIPMAIGAAAGAASGGGAKGALMGAAGGAGGMGGMSVPGFTDSSTTTSQSSGYAPNTFNIGDTGIAGMFKNVGLILVIGFLAVVIIKVLK